MVTRTLLALALALLGTAGCPCGDGRGTFLYDGFDEPCADGPPCDWDVTGDVSSVATLHAGERGLRLGSGAALGRELTGDGAEADLALDVLVRCEASTRLQVVLVLVDEDIERHIDVATVPATRDATTFVRFESPLEVDGQPPRGEIPRYLRVEVDGPGACVIDELFIFRGPAFDCSG